MKNSKGLLAKSITVALLGLVVAGNTTAAPVTITPQEIKAANAAVKSKIIVPDVITPKTNDYSGEDELPIPEGVKPIQGMNIPLQMREVKIYGLDHKAYGVAFLRKAIANAAQYHNKLKEAPAIKNNFKIQRKGKAYSILVNSEAYLAFVYAVAQEITNKYQSDQFLLARAIVPEQKINQKGSSIEICVAEGYLSSAPSIVLPPETKNSDKIKRKLAPHLSKLTKMKPLDFRALERALLLIRDMPGVEIKTTFKQALNTKKIKKSKVTSSICETALNNGAGSTALEVRAFVKRIDGEISVDNFGTESLGPEIIRFKVGANSVFKAGDMFALSVGNATDSGETLNFKINAQTPIGTNGIKAKFFHSSGEAEPGGFGVGSGINVTNSTQVTGVSVEYPYIRSRKKNLAFEVGLRSHKVLTDSAAGSLEDSNLSTLRLRSTYDFSDKYQAVNLVSVELVAGLSGEFSSNVSADRNLNENFVMARGELARYQAISLPQKATGNLTWINSLSWQYTDDPLFSSEEFALGGREYGRGYDLAVITGDQAVAAKSELQYTNKTKYGTYKTYGFADYGQVKNIDKGSLEKDKSQRLASAGVGAEFEAINNWFGKIEIAKPVKINVADDDIEMGVHTYLQIGYRW